MKKALPYLFSSALLGAGSGCKKEEAAYVGCATDAPVEFALHKASGFVSYDKPNSSYAIHYIVPGSIDTDYTGIVCSLPQGIEQGQKVEFSGNYRPYTGAAAPQLGGQKYYNLELTTISAQ